MDMDRKIYLLILFSLVLATGFAQNETASQFNTWYMYFGNHKIADKWKLHTEYQWRRHGLVQEWQQSLARIGLDYAVKPEVMITAGYAWIESYPYGEQPIGATFSEHRIWQQLILNQRPGRMGFQHRYRLEQRYLQNKITTASGVESDGYRFRNRVRYRFFASYPLNRPVIEPDTWFLAFYDEVFIGFGRGIAKNVLDQNRLYGALGYQVNAAAQLQLGYLFHRVFKPDGIQREDNHTLQMALFYNMDFTK